MTHFLLKANRCFLLVKKICYFLLGFERLALFGSLLDGYETLHMEIENFGSESLCYQESLSELPTLVKSGGGNFQWFHHSVVKCVLQANKISRKTIQLTCFSSQSPIMTSYYPSWQTQISIIKNHDYIQD